MLPLSHILQGPVLLRIRERVRLVHTNFKYLRRYALCRRLKPGLGIVNSRVVLLLRSVEIKPLSFRMCLCVLFSAPVYTICIPPLLLSNYTWYSSSSSLPIYDTNVLYRVFFPLRVSAFRRLLCSCHGPVYFCCSCIGGPETLVCA